LRKLWRWQTIVLGFVVYLLGVSTMIVAQLRALVVGVFRPGKFESFAMRSEGDLKPLAGTLSLYLTKVTQTFFPMMPVLSILVVLAIALFLKNQKKDKQSFILLMASSPLWLLAWHFRNMNHSFLGLESLAVILLAWLIIWLWQQKWQWLSLLLVFLFLYNQMQMMKVENELQRSMYFVPQGANYSYLLQAVDYTYQQANGQKFTISSLTNPFGYNTLWAYLYSWYGQRQYGYMPSFVGPDQTGIFGGDLLPQQSTPSAIHFAIEEPGPGIPDILYVQFMQKQDSIAGTSSASKLFGSLRVIEYNQK